MSFQKPIGGLEDMVQQDGNMKFEATFSGNGRVMTRIYDKPDATEEDVIEWFGLRESSIDWFSVKRIDNGKRND